MGSQHSTCDSECKTERTLRTGSAGSAAPLLMRADLGLSSQHLSAQTPRRASVETHAAQRCA
tara:strand:+ start:2218 stop:2403 length:186 start_codon:yes stop_codon:yes gene_type:complete